MARSYTGIGYIFIYDTRINPRSFDGLYIKLITETETMYLPLEYPISESLLGQGPNKPLIPPTVFVYEGHIVILDELREILRFMNSFDSPTLLSIKLRS